MHSIDGSEIAHRLCWKACKMASLTKRRGEGRSCKPSSKVCVHRKAPEMGADRFFWSRTKKIRRATLPGSKIFFGWLAGMRASHCYSGRSGLRKGWGGEEGKKKRKPYPKMIGEGKKTNLDNIQPFGILET